MIFYPWDIEQIWRCVLVFFYGTMWWDHLPSDEKIMMGLGYAAMVGVLLVFVEYFMIKAMKNTTMNGQRIIVEWVYPNTHANGNFLFEWALRGSF